ncbi:type IV toxin-antitoxin system AbiEi family antitoxin domain-containing protein [Cyclobacterium plantarum]|uniref:type IV toxin-antitoxin system AbiEi family antitoxin domain-containing protein n=1 Tax=Cyclobacterium plantarum TaxID=2716263 RepID=UPI003F72402F
MKITDFIANSIDRLPKGYIFTYADLTDEVNKKEAVIKALNRMAQAGKIAKLSKGKYYKPEKTVFGNLQPEQKQVVKDLLEEDGKVTGYLTGLSMFNKLGLTTQVSNTIQIGKNQTRPRFKRERYTVSFIKQKNTITRENIPLLQILDAIRYIKKIPDTSMEQICKRFLAILTSLSPKEKKTLIRLALKYPPATRALLGAMLDQMQAKDLTAPLFQSLNPITQYNILGISKVLSTSERWNIV